MTKLTKKITAPLSQSRLAVPLLIATLVGVLTGFVTVGFVKIIHFSEHFFFDTGEKALSFLGQYWIILIPIIGGLLVGPIVTFLAPEAKGHGVPEVMKAIVLKGGRIRPIVVLAKALASTIAIGTGASVGREGPIVQVGSALGSTIGQIFKMSELRIKNLVACGAAAGIAGVFNTPIAGVMFALEVILRDFGARALSTVVVAAVSASVVSRMFLGDAPAFIAPTYALSSPFEMFIYLGLGIASALAAWTFMKMLHFSENVFESWKFPAWLKPAVGGLGIGMIGFFFPQVFGSGLETIENAIHGNLELKILLILIVLKMIATSVSLGSGSSGGVFAPALFVGAVLGGSVGKLFYGRVPFDMAPPGAYAMVGMASVFAGAAHAPVTAILIVFEMTGDYKLILPLMVATVVSVSLAQLISRESIYTEKLKQKGIDIDSMEEVKVLGAIQVRDAMTKDFVTVPQKMKAQEVVELMSKETDKTFFVTNEKKEMIGAIKKKDLQAMILEEDLSIFVADDITTSVPDYCFSDEALSDAAQLMREHHVTEIPVVEETNAKVVIGVLRSADIFNAYTQLSLHRDKLVSGLDQEDTHAQGTSHMRFSITSRSGLAGKFIRDLALPDGTVLTSIVRGTKTLVPEGHTELRNHDKIWAVVHPEHEDAFRGWLIDNNLDKTLIEGF